MARALALIALRTYWRLAGLGSVALAPLALSCAHWRLALIASVDSLALLRHRGSYCSLDLVALKNGTHCSLDLSAMCGSYCSSDSLAQNGLLLHLWTHWLENGVWHLLPCRTYRLFARENGSGSGSLALALTSYGSGISALAQISGSYCSLVSLARCVSTGVWHSLLSGLTGS